MALRKVSNQPYIGVIETTIMYNSDQQNDRLISVFTLFVEEPSRHLILIRFYEDFIEFDKRVKNHLKKFKTPLPKLQSEEDLLLEQEDDTVENNDPIFKKKIFNFAKRNRRTNSTNLEKYLRYCANDPNIQSCSLFKEFLQPQREGDHMIPKKMIQSIVQEQTRPGSTQHALTDDPSMQTLSTGLYSLNTEPVLPSPTPTAPPPTPTITPPTPTSNPPTPTSNTPPLPHTTVGNLNPSEITTNTQSSFTSSTQSVTIQDFQLIKVIGRGCMGKVLLVRHKKTSKLLALKAMSKKAVVEHKQIAHIRAEQQILADVSSIHHPFLVKLHYSFQDMNQLFLVLDYHVGGDLATQLRLNQTLNTDRCRFYTAEIILGIQELHRLGILYRDLKPENVLLTVDGHIVLTDFGLSKQFYDGLSYEDQHTETFCGTAEYLAPEIIRNLPYSYEVDYWSMGTILYEMLTGITPFWSENQLEMYRRIQEDKLLLPSYMDLETADFIAQLLRRDPKKRLGHGIDGAIRVRNHPYFETIDWDLIYNKKIKPPYIPNLYSETDFSHFDSEFLRLTPRLSPVESDYRLSQSQSLDQAFEGYSYTNREESTLDSPPSELYSLHEPPSPVTLMDAGMNRGESHGSDIRYFVFNDSDDVIPYDEDEDSLISGEDIHSSDLVRQDSHLFHHYQDDYPPRPARPVTRDLSMTPPFSVHNSYSETSSISFNH